MDNKIILFPIPLDEFEKRISDILERRIRDISATNQRFIPIKKACEMYGISHPTIYNWKRDGLIKVYNLNGKAFINYIELESAIERYSNNNP